MKFIGLMFIIIIHVYAGNADECTTPNNEKANCISLYSCPVLLKGLATAQEEQLEFVRKSNCGGTGVNPLVCCGTASNFIKTNNSTPDLSGRDLLPSTKFCGLQHSDDYFHDKIQAIVTEFPWLAHIEFDGGNGERRFLCIGSLINDRYILTAAHCAKSPLFDPVGVRLGEYSIQNTTDCSEYLGQPECSQPAKNYAIDSITLHPDYNRRRKINDIALIRLNTTVTYSDYIRPICLPSSTTNSPKVGDLVSSSGWGRADFQSEAVDIKKKIQSKIISNEECHGFVNKLTSVQLTEKQFCMKDVENSYYITCQGDSGSPVMYKHRAQWYQEGIVSFGIGCGSSNPTVLERVPDHLEWIVKNIKP